MAKLRLDQIRDRMNQCSNQINTKIAEEKNIVKSIQTITNNYDQLTSKISKEKEQTQLKTTTLHNISKNVTEVKDQVDAEKDLIGQLNMYLTEYNEADHNTNLTGVQEHNIDL
jgi:archaellum component FlaC